ncbi:MAG TPA: septum formation family protein [Gammaproteobacteria bacterium]|jgi:hypothetical protein
MRNNWVIAAAVAGGGYLVNMALTADRDSTGAIVDAGDVSAFEIRVGDCFDDAGVFSEENAEVSKVPGIPCSAPHDNEVYAVFDVSVSSFPEGDEMSSMAFDSCLERFQSFVGKDYESSTLDIATLYPSRESWNQQNDREVVCVVYDVNAKKLTGSVRGLGI